MYAPGFTLAGAEHQTSAAVANNVILVTAKDTLTSGVCADKDHL